MIKLGVKKGFGIVAVLIFVGVLVMVGSVIAAAVILNNDSADIATETKLEQERQDRNKDDEFGVLNQEDSALNLATPSPSPEAESSATSAPSVFTQPQGLYKITLPASWVVNSTFATKTYSTTKFVGPIGSISITFGDGKDPVGGCSEASAITLADRIISGCFLLQKDGSRILTRAYTKDKAGMTITVEAYMSAPLASNQPAVISVVKSIDIN